MSELTPVEALYREVVLDHYRRPRNRTALAHPQGSALVHNPLCGDQVQVEGSLEDGRIADVSARTRGCSIAVAAGSVMTELVVDQTPELAAALHAEVDRLIAGEPSSPDLDRRLRAFERVAELSARHRCATLPWEALAEALSDAAS